MIVQKITPALDSELHIMRIYASWSSVPSGFCSYRASGPAGLSRLVWPALLRLPPIGPLCIVYLYSLMSLLFDLIFLRDGACHLLLLAS